MLQLISSFVTVLVPSAFLLIFVTKLANWIYLTFWTCSELDLSIYGGRREKQKYSYSSSRTPKAWALITGASDGIGAAFAKVKLKEIINFISNISGISRTKF